RRGPATPAAGARAGCATGRARGWPSRRRPGRPPGCARSPGQDRTTAGPLRTLPARWTRSAVPRPSVLAALGAHERLADVGEQLAEPRHVDVEGLPAADARELDRAQLVAALLVVADDAGAALPRGLDRAVDHLLDQREVGVVGAGGAGEVAALLHHRLLGADQRGELLGEPGARVDRVELDVPERVPLHLLAGGLQLGDDLRHAGTLRQEDVDVADLVHDAAQPLRLGLHVDVQLGQEHRVHVPPLAG